VKQSRDDKKCRRIFVHISTIKKKENGEMRRRKIWVKEAEKKWENIRNYREKVLKGKNGGEGVE
jgi:hypothetical protein